MQSIAFYKIFHFLLIPFLKMDQIHHQTLKVLFLYIGSQDGSEERDVYNGTKSIKHTRIGGL